jgi:CS domain.
MDFTNDERFDGLYLNVAQTARGIEPLLDTLFSFLRRKTDFFNGPNGQDTDAAIEKVNQVLMKHVELHKAEQAKKKKQKEMEEERKKKKVSAKKEVQKDTHAPKNTEDDVIEMGDDGFDVSSPSISKSSPTDQDMESSKDVENDAVCDQDKDGKNGKEKEEESLAPVGNGGTVEGKYVWTQTLSELNVCIPLPQNTKGRDLNVIMKKDHLKAGLKMSPEPIVDAPLTHSIICDDSFWTVEDGNRLVINLQKLNQMEWWDSVCKGDPKIDITKVQPENSRLEDLDGETRQTVEKMMFDQRQKALGLPTSDDQKKMEALERFKRSHPELDFSNAKIS